MKDYKIKCLQVLEKCGMALWNGEDCDNPENLTLTNTIQIANIKDYCMGQINHCKGNIQSVWQSS